METTNEQGPSQGQLVHANTIMLIVRSGSFGNSKQGSMADVTVDADKKLLRISKQLLDSPELSEVQKHYRSVFAQVRRLSFPSPLFKGGTYLLPIGVVTQVTEILNNGIENAKPLIDAAVKVYETRVNETATRLGVQYNPADYPSVDRYRASFYLEFSYSSWETPSKLKAISQAIFASETEKARVRLESVAEECQQAMRAGLSKLVDHLADRLAPNPDGTVKRLNTSAIKNLNEFLSSFELKDVTGDGQLAALVQKARSVMEGVDQKTLKSDDLIRQKVMNELTSLKGALEPLIDESDRMITFEEDEVEAEALASVG